ncbi:MAG TPA: dihydrofolate reductase family protein [Nevskiaceae bacterium]|nr:dihydrofolate reductase family protein [Nevskiaceae bacterium]
MRKLIVLSFISLDGVMQAPGAPEEDTSGGFKYGGWTVPYADEVSNKRMVEQMGHPYDLLLGKRTYDIFAGYWPQHNEPGNTIGNGINAATKYVATHTLFAPVWEKTVVLEGDAAEAVRKLKQENGPELQVHGSGNFIQTLFKNDLVDELWLKTYPVTLGEGKRLFAEGTIPAAFRLTHSEVTPKGVIFANYEHAGDVQTGSF